MALTGRRVVACELAATDAGVGKSGVACGCWVEEVATVEDERGVHDLAEIGEVDRGELLPLCGDNKCLGIFRGIKRGVGDAGSVDELELQCFFGALWIVDGDIGAFGDEIAHDVYGNGGTNIVGVWLEGESPDGDFFVLEHPEGLADSCKEALALAAVDFFNFLEEREGHSEILADGDEGGDVLGKAGASVADTSVEEVATDATVHADAVGDLLDVRTAGPQMRATALM